MTNLESKKLELLSLYVDGQAYEEIVKKVDDLIENPYFFFDASFRLYSTSSKKKTNGKYLKSFDKDTILSYEILEEINKSNDLDAIKNSTDIIVKKFSGISNSVMIKRIYDNKYTYGYICLYEKNRKFNSDDEQLLNTISSIIVHAFKTSGYANKVDYLVFKQIIDGKLTDVDEINNLLSNLNLNESDDMRIMIIQTNKLHQLYNYLLSKNTEGKVFIHNSDVVCFVSSERNRSDIVIREAMDELKDDNIQIGISDVFNDYAYIATYYKQAIESIQIGKKFLKESHIHYNEDYRMLSLINRISDDELEKIIDSRVSKIVKYDKENATNYINDIEVYFASGRNINKASKMLFIHKNSMYYRMDKIRELFGLDLENENDCFNIELSLKLLRLLNTEE